MTDSVSQITGPVLDAESTNDLRPVLSGTGTPNERHYHLATRWVQASRRPWAALRWTVTVTGAGVLRSNIGEGTHEYTATATDEAGNESVPSAGITITVDTLAPDTPVISDIAGAQNGGPLTTPHRP